ncbi:MAG: TorF family putative porin [Alphaproteobacteria bacterium]|nr:hypothetical protein [Alphaproteobacteria bacterium]MBP7759422.1 TorF family putative porin [Alphaproteobacteria bacterium]MBP7762699.1 TorF family putative porin [Alphaproteobacteria bacterium]MBP7905000.1 TorF family putative porin [Alphaproteobacteria bacterium]
MNKRLLLSVCAGTALISGAASAENPLASSGISFSGNLGFVTEYSFRGIAQSNEKPAIQGGFDVNHTSGLYAGVWGSNVDFNDGDEATVEIDAFVGYAGEFKGLSYDLGLIYYAYPGADDSLDYDYWEFAASMGYDFEVAALTASFNYSPNNFADSGHAEYYALSADVPIYKELSLTAHVGHQEIDEEEDFGVDDYNDWSVGLGYSLYGFDASLQYVDTDLDETEECADGCEDRVIFGVSRTF